MNFKRAEFRQVGTRRYNLLRRSNFFPHQLNRLRAMADVCLVIYGRIFGHLERQLKHWMTLLCRTPVVDNVVQIV